MADQKTTALSPFTPILTDMLYGVDDPGGTPVSGKLTLTAIRDLLQANLTTAVASTGYDISTDVNLRRDAADTLAQRRGTNAQTFNIYNTFTDASNYERGGLVWVGNRLELFTDKAGTGSGHGITINTRNVGGNDVVMSTGQVRPDTDGTAELGGALAQWGNIYGGANVFFTNLPTADPVSAGQLWNDAGTLKVSAG